jgi:hypothetical protein
MSPPDTCPQTSSHLGDRKLIAIPASRIAFWRKRARPQLAEDDVVNTAHLACAPRIRATLSPWPSDTACNPTR